MFEEGFNLEEVKNNVLKVLEGNSFLREQEILIKMIDLDAYPELSIEEVLLNFD